MTLLLDGSRRLAQQGNDPYGASGTVSEDESVTDLYTTDGGLSYREGADANTEDDEAFRRQVQAEQERIFRDYQLEVPVADGATACEDSLLSDAHTLPSTPEGLPRPPNRGRSSAAADASADDAADAHSVMTENPLFRANMEAEERRLMAEFDFDYSVQSSFDVFDAPVPVPPSAGSSQALSHSSLLGPYPLGVVSFAPLAPSVATADNTAERDVEGGAGDRAQQEEYADTTSTLPEDNTSTTDEDGAPVVVPTVAVATKPSRSSRPASAPTASSFSVVQSALKLLLPAAYGNQRLVASNPQSTLGRATAPPSIEPKNSSGAGSGSHSSPATEKTLTPTASDSKQSPPGSPNRSHSTVKADHSTNLPPPSIIILGTVAGSSRDAALPDAVGTEGGQGSGNCASKTMRRLLSDWVGRVILLLLLAIVLSVAVAVGGLVVYRNSGNSASDAASSASSGESANGQADDYFARLTAVPDQPVDEVSLNRTQPPDVLRTTVPTMLRATAKPSAPPPPTPRPTVLQDTGATSPAPVVVIRPTPAPSVPRDGACQDSSNATFFINSEHGFQDCAFLSTNMGIKQLLCQEPYDPARLCPATCGTCPDLHPEEGAGTTKPPVPPTPSPTVVETNEATPNVTSSETSPTTAPSTAGTPGSSSSSGSTLRDIVSNVAPDSVKGRLEESGSAADQALQWMEQDLDSLLELDEDAVVQRFAVAAFAFSTDVDQWASSSGWLSTVSESVGGGDDNGGGSSSLSAGECSWYGIGCDDSGIVTSIELPDNGLAGSLPPELALLSSSLVRVHVSENQISGSLPSEFGLLSKLDTLLMDNNKFLGSLPSQIGQMTSLTRWHVQYNDLTGTVPESIKQLTGLQELYLWHNELEGTLPSEVCAFEGLDQLMVDCRKVEIECWTRCYYQCGGSTGVACDL